MMTDCGHITHKFVLDVDEVGIRARIPLRRGDSMVHKISVRLTRGGITLRLPGMIWARAEATRPDGSTVFEDCAFDGIRYTFTVPSGFTCMSGATLCRIVLRGGEGEELYSPAFALDAEETPLPDDVSAADEYSPMGEAVRTVEECRRECADSVGRVTEMIEGFRDSASAQIRSYVDELILKGEW